jgi:hypothetical protein
VRELLLFLHVLAAATWIGAALWVPGDVRRTLALGRPAADALAARVAPALRLDLYAGAAVLLTGISIISVEGGRPRLGITLGLLFTMARLGVVGGAMLPAWRRVEAAIAGGGELAAAAASARRMAMLSGIAHALWILALAGMIFQV